MKSFLFFLKEETEEDKLKHIAHAEDRPLLHGSEGFTHTHGALMQAHEGLNESQSQLLNARLILVMANHIGHVDVLKQAIKLARNHLDD
jgi:hypothetical protein